MSSGLFMATIPPNGELRSVAKALPYASTSVAAASHAARVRVLDDGDGGFVKFGDERCRRADVENIIEGKLLAVELFEDLDENEPYSAARWCGFSP